MSKNQKSTINRELSTLEANAYSIEDFSYFKKFDESEIENKREVKIKNDLQLRIYKEEVKQFKSDRMKPLEKVNESLLDELKTGGRHITEKCYFIADYDKGVMDILNSDCEIVSSRKLLPEERQGRLQIGKTGTDTF